jgi:hypothetical protein
MTDPLSITESRIKIEQVGVTVECIREVLVSNLGRDTIFNKVFRGFPHSSQANAGIVPRLD